MAPLLAKLSQQTPDVKPADVGGGAEAELRGAFGGRGVAEVPAAAGTPVHLRSMIP